ncbi:hypothetical protein JHS3_01670 [Jeongeupia sp. HS-3]|uniref:hypothetical protein n=1 Tax=Jeongeupia sp. HS-3 TaxID=1009682 RepID=UPI0018A54696|nr:hypothetical protein [Jeongeupia sp. HS-3]BCL74431.1 hypothetical protein JHS3_01670 [Jeongeupia sp. HS-3]
MTQFQSAAPLVLALLLAACGGSDGGEASAPVAAAAKVSVDALPAGSYTVSSGDDGQPGVGQYYAGSDGSRLMVVNDDDEGARTLYKQSASGVWSAVPPAKTDVTLHLSGYEPRASPLAEAAQLAGNYTVPLAAGGVAMFALSAQGAIAAMGSGCQISGQTGASKLPGALAVSLKFAGCNGLPSSASGVLLADPDYAPAKLRLLVDDGSVVADLWAYVG